MLRTDAIESPLKGMGDALLRMAQRNACLSTSEENRRAEALMMSVIMKGMELSEARGSVCVTASDLENLATEPIEATASEDEDDYVSAACQTDDPFDVLPNGPVDPEVRLFVREGFRNLAGKGLLVTYRAGEKVESNAPFILDGDFDDDNPRLYAARYFAEECSLAEKLLSMADAGSNGATLSKAMTANVDKLSRALNRESENTRQKEAVKMALTHRLTIVSGGPGTGKTTTVGLILECLLADMKVGDALLDETEKPLRIYLAAPTGKATGRMRQSIQNLTSIPGLREAFVHLGPANRAEPGARALIESRTIHKWLATNTSSGLRPGPENPLEADVLVIDEASMIDVHLAAKLFAAVGEHTRVIVLGDKYQLAAVGPGAVFADISRTTGGLSKVTVRLTESRRFSETSVIADIAHAINHDSNESDEKAMETITKRLQPKLLKERASSLKKTETEVLDSIRRRILEEADAGEDTGRQNTYAVDAYPDAATRLGFSETARAWIDGHLSLYIDALIAYIGEKNDGNLTRVWNALMDFRPLCAQRHGPQSVAALNAYMIQEVKARLSKENLYDETMLGSCWPGAVIIVRQNDDMLGVYNGDVGVVLPVKKADGSEELMTVFGDTGLEEGKGLRIPPSLLPKHDAAFAMTIHQSQGSEFRHVAVFLPMSPDSPLATRELLYTGVTRTKESVTIFGRVSVLQKAVETATTRISGLAARLDTAQA